MLEITEQFIEEKDVVFEMRALVDGEPVVIYTSEQSFDDLAGYAGLADDAFDAYVVGEEEAKEDYKQSLEQDREDGGY